MLWILGLSLSSRNNASERLCAKLRMQLLVFKTRTLQDLFLDYSIVIYVLMFIYSVNLWGNRAGNDRAAKQCRVNIRHTNQVHSTVK